MFGTKSAIGTIPTPPWQQHCATLGKTGCLFLVLCEVGRRVLGRIPANLAGPILDDFLYALNKKWVGPDCYVEIPTALLKYLTGGREWEYIKTKDLKDARIGDWIIGCYKSLSPLKEEYHFALLDSKGVLEWDPYGNSETIANGKIHSYRLLRML